MTSCCCCQAQCCCPLLHKDELTSDEIYLLARCTVAKKFGNGLTRKKVLGDWYGVIQAFVNYGILKGFF